MFTQRVRDKLRKDYGIKNIPHEMLAWLVAKHKARYEADCGKNCDCATCAWLVANDYQKGIRA